MNRNTKTLGLALVVVFAMSVVASAAQASVQIEAAENVNMSGGQKTKHSLTIDGNNVECNSVTFNTNETVKPGGGAGVSTTIKMHPSYNGCKAFTFLNATVETSNCNYEVTGVNNINANEWNASLTIICSGLNTLTITAGTCVAHIGNQTVNNGLTMKSTDHGASPMNFDVVFSNAPVAVSRTDGAFCPFNGNGPSTGFYNGTTELSCANGGGVGISCTVTNMP